MKTLIKFSAIAMLMAACAADEEPTTDGGGDGGDGGTPPVNGTVTIGALSDATYDPATSRLALTITLDGDDVAQVYTRNAAYDAAGYRAYTLQDDPLDRFFTALVATSADGTVTAVAAGDGGQFNTYFGGAHVTASDYVAPASGLVSYVGEYAGITNIGTRDGTAPATGDPILLPLRPIQTTGQVFLNADFTDNAINGAIYDREAVGGAAIATPDLILLPGDIDASGAFSGSIELIDFSAVGSYSGVFGGDGATSIGGAIRITDFDEALENEEETGIFVMTQCGITGASPLCGTLGVDSLGE